MDPITGGIVFNLLKRYWWVGLIAILCVCIWILYSMLSSKDKVINELKESIVLKTSEIKDLKIKIDTQNKAIDDYAQKGKEQADKLNIAITKVNSMKPATQVIIREIYSDATKDIDKLLLNATTD